MRIAGFAREIGYSVGWVRLKERQGLLPAPPRDPAGHRHYGPEHVEEARRRLFGEQGKAVTVGTTPPKAN